MDDSLPGRVLEGSREQGAGSRQPEAEAKGVEQGAWSQSMCSPGLAPCTSLPAPSQRSALEFSLLVILVFQQYEAEATIVFTSEDSPPRPAWADGEEQLVRDTIAYLELRRLRVEPGDLLRKAWEQFYTHNDPLVRQITRAHRIPGSDVENCVQEVWLEIVRKLGSFDCNPLRGRFRSWIGTLVERKVARFAKDRSRRVVATLDESNAFLICPDGDPVAHFEQECRCRMVRLALVQLEHEVSSSTYQVIRLRWIEQKSVAEAGLRLELTSEQVYHRNTRGLRKLREILTRKKTDWDAKLLRNRGPAEEAAWAQLALLRPG